MAQGDRLKPAHETRREIREKYSPQRRRGRRGVEVGEASAAQGVRSLPRLLSVLCASVVNISASRTSRAGTGGPSLVQAIALGWRQQYGGDRLRGDAFAAAGEAEPFRCGRLDRDAARINAEDIGQPRGHRRGVRGDLRAFADQCDVGVDQPPAAGGDAAGGMRQERALSASFQAASQGGKWRPISPSAERAVDRVAQRVDPTSASEWPARPLSNGIVTPHSTTSGRAQRMHVEAGPTRGIRWAVMARLQPGQVLGVGQLDVVFGPATTATAAPDRLQQRGIVGGRADVPARWAASRVAKRNACGVWARNRPSRGTLARIRPSAARLSVRPPAPPGWPPAMSPGRRAGQRWCRRDERTGGIVDQHQVGRVGHQRLQAGPHAVLARRAAGHRRKVRQPGERGGDRSASPTGCSSATCRASVSAAWRITGLPPSVTNCLGVSAPNRLPGRPRPGWLRSACAIASQGRRLNARKAKGALPPWNPFLSGFRGGLLPIPRAEYAPSQTQTG